MKRSASVAINSVNNIFIHQNSNHSFGFLHSLQFGMLFMGVSFISFKKYRKPFMVLPIVNRNIDLSYFGIWFKKETPKKKQPKCQTISFLHLSCPLI